jgi:hypothetical protein
VNARFAQALRGAAAPDGLTTWNGSDPAQRFAVYRNNVAASLRAALAAKFPLVEKLVGADYFAALAGAFARAHLPRAPRLALYGEDFADFVASFPPLARWPYLADVARLDAARLAAYHAADAPALGPADFAAVDDLAGLRLALHPCLRVVASPFAVLDMARALDAGDDCAGIDPDRAQTVVVARPRLDVLTLAAPPGMDAFLDALARGETVAAAVEATPGFDVGEGFRLIVAQGLARAFVAPEAAS